MFHVFLFRIEALKSTEEQDSALPMSGREIKERDGGERRGKEGKGGERRGKGRGGGTGGREAGRVKEGSREKKTRAECKGSCFYPWAG